MIALQPGLDLKTSEMTEHLLRRGAGVFEITDHTTASDWERFIAQLEETITDLNIHKQSRKEQDYKELPPGLISNSVWRERRRTLYHGPNSLELAYLFLDETLFKDTTLGHSDESSQIGDENLSRMSDKCDSPIFEDAEDINDESVDDEELDMERSMMKNDEIEHKEHELPDNLPECLRDMVSFNNDFAPKAHCLVRWYNLRRFIILSLKGDTIISEDRMKLYLSSASIALANTDCHVPIFIQIRNPRTNFYQGVSEHYNIRTTYDMVFFDRSFSKYSYLSDLMGLFREKTGSNLNDPITVTVRVNYCLDNFELFLKPEDEFTGNETDGEDEAASQVGANIAHEFKPVLDPDANFEQISQSLDDIVPHPFKILRFLHVAALWPPLSDKIITDSQVHSDLDPAEAPIWIIRCLTSDRCHMSVIHNTQAIYGLLKDAIDYAFDKMDAIQVFDDCDRDSLKNRCLRLSYDLATKPEVVLSSSSTDSMRKLIALLFYRATELSLQNDAIDQVAAHLKRRPSLSEVYRDFVRTQRPSVKEFILRTQVSRPFAPITSPALPQRLFCTICDNEFRLCGAFSELCN